jgi:ribosome maturation factor RimP
MNAAPQIQAIESKIEALISAEPGLFLVEAKIKPTNNIKVFLDSETGVSIEKCVYVNRKLYKLLEEKEIYPNGDFSLEVSSPGLDRPLKKQADYDRFVGRLIKVRTYQPFLDDSGNKRKTFLGKLEGLVDGTVKMTLTEGQTASIPIEKVAKANLEFEL